MRRAYPQRDLGLPYIEQLHIEIVSGLDPFYAKSRGCGAAFLLFSAEHQFHRFVLRAAQHIDLPVSDFPSYTLEPLSAFAGKFFIQVFEKRFGVKELLKIERKEIQVHYLFLRIGGYLLPEVGRDEGIEHPLAQCAVRLLPLAHDLDIQLALPVFFLVVIQDNRDGDSSNERAGRSNDLGHNLDYVLLFFSHRLLKIDIFLGALREDVYRHLACCLVTKLNSHRILAGFKVAQ